jgi:lysyl-tRNA synthetase class 2
MFTGRPRFSRSLEVCVAALALCLLGIAPAQATEPLPQHGIISRIPRQSVDSSGIASVGYSKRLRALEIEFRRGGTYRYLDVPAAVHRQLLAAESKAGFYNRHVRGKYESVYVRPRRKK